MKFLLTSAGIKNTSIYNALVDLLGKPIAEASALCIPTAVYAIPGGAGHAWRFFSGQATTPMCELGWKSMGVLELTALPSIDEELWVPMVQETDVLLVNGGDPLYLCYWMRQSGLADLLPSLSKTVYVGLSAGSMVMAPNIGEDFVRWKPLTGGDRALGLVDFAMFPHLDHEMLPDNSMADAERWAAGMRAPAYAIDDQTAIKVIDGVVEVVSEGHWKRFAPQFVVSHPCTVCHGHGDINGQACPTCRGTGVERFFHGTKANLETGDLIEPGRSANYGKLERTTTYVYLTGTLDAATWGAELALGEGRGRIYRVEPTGAIEDDPNLTDKKFPGNPTKSYRSREPLRVVGEVVDWQGHSPEELKAMKHGLERLKQQGVEPID